MRGNTEGRQYRSCYTMIQPHCSIGTRNLVLEARLCDGVRWVLKIYVLAPEAPNDPCFPSSISGSASDEFADRREIYETFQQEFEALEFIQFLSLTSNQPFLF